MNKFVKKKGGCIKKKYLICGFRIIGFKKESKIKLGVFVLFVKRNKFQLNRSFKYVKIIYKF